MTLVTADTGKPDTDPRQAILDDPLFREFAGDIAVRLDRLEAMGMMPEAVCIRAGLWPPIAEWQGYPVVRLVPSSAVMWGVLA